MVAVLALAGCAAAGAGSGGSSAPTGAPATTLRVGPLSTQNLLTLAVDDGLAAQHLADVGVDLAVSPSFPAFAPAAEALAAGHVDVVSGSTTAVVAALAGTPDLVVVAVEHDAGDTQGIVAHGDVTDVAGLAGRSVAVNRGGTGEYLLRLALREAGLTPEDVTVEHLAPPDAASAFAAGRVDAWATWDQYLVGAQALPGVRTVALARDLGSDNRTVHVTTRDVVERHPAAVAALYDALVAEADALRADPARRAGAYRASGADAQVAAALGALETPDVRPADDGFAAELARVAALYVEEGMIPGAVDVTGVAVDATRLIRAEDGGVRP
ncbi:ABC transporter substrate-binding protein [Cellulomonas sp. zg-ZUI199]|uniref:ABC transporter substrate-binding protein n=1 Tax=Cellulomonas wangleii TaxID=2816956 RepID=A0ABX8D341_9CELL|nr:ABC transporter substrate-binding protein [Cellulomonas wangleii]MBO0923454.1 ABC transporter substrate-binding protein [Cellulomonas wangleii]QVI61799.1 ABC transporter substrate-binding protein [Cellulomonas wangleii]